MTTDETVKALGKAAAGLLYPSETDSPFETFVWREIKAIDAATVEKHTRPKGERKARPVKEVTTNAFFDELLDADDMEGFKHLKEAVGKLLKDVRVFFIGGPKVEVRLVGLAASGEAAGLRTVSVET